MSVSVELMLLVAEKKSLFNTVLGSTAMSASISGSLGSSFMNWQKNPKETAKLRLKLTKSAKQWKKYIYSRAGMSYQMFKHFKWTNLRTGVLKGLYWVDKISDDSLRVYRQPHIIREERKYQVN